MQIYHYTLSKAPLLILFWEIKMTFSIWPWLQSKTLIVLNSHLHKIQKQLYYMHKIQGSFFNTLLWTFKILLNTCCEIVLTLGVLWQWANDCNLFCRTWNEDGVDNSLLQPSEFIVSMHCFCIDENRSESPQSWY